VELTPRERHIVEFILAGAANKTIAAALGITEQSVKNRLTTLYRKYGVRSRLELAVTVVSKKSEV
jgi:DNA-binding NarL/FixJ family response regulator